MSNKGAWPFGILWAAADAPLAALNSEEISLPYQPKYPFWEIPIEEENERFMSAELMQGTRLFGSPGLDVKEETENV